MQHLRYYTADGKWEGAKGSVTGNVNANGPDYMRNAIRLLRATFIGYHGPADQWLVRSFW